MCAAVRHVSNIFDWLRRRGPQRPTSAPSAASTPYLVEAWRSFIGDKKSWVLFSHGTCVILRQPSRDLHGQAIELLQEWGPVYPGSPYGDFTVLTHRGKSGWVVKCHHPDIMTYVMPDEPP